MLVIQTQGTRFATQGRETAQGNLKTNNHGHVQHHEPCNHEPRTHSHTYTLNTHLVRPIAFYTFCVTNVPASRSSRYDTSDLRYSQKAPYL